MKRIVTTAAALAVLLCTACHPRYPGFVWVDGGTFLMGSPDGGQHQVTLAGFYMAQYEVTRQEYKSVMGEDTSVVTWGGDTLPVRNASWYDAVEFCNALSVRDKFSPAYTIDKDTTDSNNEGFDDLRWTVRVNPGAAGYRLPTEAQWEYAARGGTNWDKPYYVYAGGNDVGAVAWYGGNSSGVTHEVGTKVSNALGMYDMSGNVWEWCWDWYDDYLGGAAANPEGASKGSYRILRGGGYHQPAAEVSSASRGYSAPHVAEYGFRLVKP